MTVHIVVAQRMPADRETVFDLIHDYHRRLEWDTLLRRAYTVDDATPTVGVTAVCTARWGLGGFSFRTRYVTFRRPKLAAITLVSPPPFFATWAASIRHESLSDGDSTATYTMTFRCRPRWVAWLIEPIARAGFRRETTRRLRALARAVAKDSSATS